MDSPAFCSPALVSARPFAAHGLLSRRTRARAVAPSRLRRVTRMSEDPAPEDPAITSASGILKSMREEAAATKREVPDESVPRGSLGITRDEDGKSNVWAVEPKMAVDEKPQVPKVAILVAVFACVFVALLVLPNLPFTNGDQF